MVNQKFKQTEIGKIPEDWEEKPLSEVMDIIGGGTPKTDKPEYWKGDVPWISVVDFVGGKRWIYDTEKHITEEGLRNSSTNILKKGQLIISARGTVGEIGQVTRDMAFNQSCYGLNSKEELINDFLYYLLKFNINKIRSAGHGAVFNTITTDTFKSIFVSYPSLPEQHTIAKILSDLDAKIELNSKMNKTLEAIGQALFKKWFVDERKEEWKEERLGELGEFKNGINYLRDEVGDAEFPIINVRDISNNKWILKDTLDKIKINYDKAKDYFLDEKDIIIARSACPGQTSLIFGDTKNIIYSGFSIRYRLKDINNYFYVSFVFQNLKEELRNFSIGTTLSSVSQETLKNIKIRLPDKNALQKFNEIIQPIFKQISINCFQSQTLSKIRDALLPKLMSGEIRVKNGGPF